MWIKTCWLCAVLLIFLTISRGERSNKRLVCYYDIDSAERIGHNRFTEQFLDSAQPYCTHLVYSSARLNPKNFELSLAPGHFNHSVLRTRYPHLKTFLSVGGDKDYDIENPRKYLHLLEAGREKQTRFINSCLQAVQLYGFDGLDLAFALPRNEPRKENSVTMFWNDVTKIFGGNTRPDAYKNHYTRFVGDLQDALEARRVQLSMTVLPNVNSSWIFDIAKIHPEFDFINIFAFDFNTPDRTPNEADHSAPLYYNKDQNRLSFANVDFQINHWLNNGCPASKLNLGIATYGRAWNLTVDSGLSGRPIVEDTKGPGHLIRAKHSPGGIVSWTSVCLHLPSHRRNSLRLRKVSDNYGSYAFRAADANNTNGIWISFDDPEFAGIKAKYVMDKQLGGMALFDLSYDDFRRRCARLDYPILQAVNKALDIGRIEPATAPSTRWATMVENFGRRAATIYTSH